VVRSGKWIGLGLSVSVALALATLLIIAPLVSGDYLLVAIVTLSLFIVLGLIGWNIGRKFDELQGYAEKDSLTNAFNRRFLQRVFPRLAAQAARKNKKFSVLLLDMNGFKAINDTLGHEAGDVLLRLLADSLIGSARQGEIVGRWGGDEFSVICPYSDESKFANFKQDLDEHLALLSAEWNRPLSFSVGRASFPDDGTTLEILLREADRRMYEEKRKQSPPVVQRKKA
jgi:diguanylate cyclase (GGDEF)-like protein